MRAMNMLQMAGGIAVAGAVAAGTTAFTANAGFTNSVTGAKTFLGGKGTHTIVGAELSAFAWVTTDTTVTPTRISSFRLTFTSDTPTGSVVTITPSGTVGGTTAASATPDNFYCANTDGSFQSLCTVGASLGDLGGYYTGVGALTIKVV